MNARDYSKATIVTPFIRIMPKMGHSAWMLKINHFSQLYSQTEYETVKHGVRKAAVVHVNPDNLDAMMAKFNADKLVYTPIRKSGYYEGFSHFHKPVNTCDPYFWYGCVTKTKSDGDLFKEAECATDHRTIGRLLGFPDCCINYFIKWFPKNYDPVWVEKNGKVVGFAECNNLLRYFGVRMVSHLICSPTCKKTRVLGQKWVDVMKTIDAKLADELYAFLSGPMTWNSYHGVAQIETPYFVGLTHTYPYLEKPRIINWIGGVKTQS